MSKHPDPAIIWKNDFKKKCRICKKIPTTKYVGVIATIPSANVIECPHCYNARMEKWEKENKE